MVGFVFVLFVVVDWLLYTTTFKLIYPLCFAGGVVFRLLFRSARSHNQCSTAPKRKKAHPHAYINNPKPYKLYRTPAIAGFVYPQHNF